MGSNTRFAFRKGILILGRVDSRVAIRKSQKGSAIASVDARSIAPRDQGTTSGYYLRAILGDGESVSVDLHNSRR